MHSNGDMPADGRYCIKVADHKTVGTYCPIVLLISPKVLYLMERYYTYTRKNTIPQPGCNEYFFLHLMNGGDFSVPCFRHIVIKEHL